MLEEVCASPKGPGARFVQTHLDELKKTLLDSLRSTSSPAKRVRVLVYQLCQGRTLGEEPLERVAGCGLAQRDS